MTDRGAMFRIGERNADGLGKNTLNHPTPSAAPADAESLEQFIWSEMKKCFDPEIPVNVVDLGLIYDCQIHDRPDGGFRVEIKMTLKGRALPGGQAELVYSKGKASGALIETQRADETEWSKLDKVIGRTLTDERPLLEPNRPEIRRYRGRLLFGDDPTGDYSDVVTVTVAP